MPDEQRKQMLRSMIDNMVDGNEEQTQVDFHQYATSKLQNMLGYEPVNVDEYNDFDDIDGEYESELSPDED